MPQLFLAVLTLWGRQLAQAPVLQAPSWVSTREGPGGKQQGKEWPGTGPSLPGWVVSLEMQQSAKLPLAPAPGSCHNPPCLLGDTLSSPAPAGF